MICFMFNLHEINININNKVFSGKVPSQAAAGARLRAAGAPRSRGRAHRAVGRLALEALQRGAEPAEAQDEEAQDPAGDQEQAQPDALVLGLRVLVRHAHLRHGSPAPTPPSA